MKTIGLIGGSADPTLLRMAALIRDRGGDVVWLDNARYPEHTSLSLEDGEVRLDGVDVREVKVWHLRALFLSFPVFRMPDGDFNLFQDWRACYLAQREMYATVSSWIRSVTLGGGTVVNPVETLDQHILKPLQLAMLRRAGLPLPVTLVTNRPEDVVAFAAARGRVIYKPVSGGAFCRALGPEDLQPERLELLRNAPVIFQEHIHGDNVRVCVVGNAVVSAAHIRTRALDYRGNEDGFTSLRLPESVRRLCLKAAKVTGMPYCGMDLIRTADDQWYLLECNPTPVHLGIEDLLGHPVTERLVAYLWDRA